jgi:hypothetical protein
LGVSSIGKEHTFVSGGFLVFTHTAWLRIVRHRPFNWFKVKPYFDIGSSLTCRLEILSHVSAGGNCWNLLTEFPKILIGYLRIDIALEAIV